MIKQEEIKLVKHRSGTSIKYFTTYSGQTSDDGSVSFLIVNNMLQPIKIVESLIDTQLVRNIDNNFEISTGYKRLSGTTILQNSESLSDEQKLFIKTKYQNSIKRQFDSTSKMGDENPVSFVEFKDILLDDMYINLSLNRTVDILDTLNVYNIPINSIPLIESNTGILFGKLQAIQKVIDENGNKIIIPLKNTPVAIFNPSEEFPSIGVHNDQDNRITLNLKENINIGSYFNKQSEKTDLKYLTDTSNFKSIPPKYKYSAITNDKGEFIIYNVPVGAQTFMYEVNLLKQGLTADEVALNFTSYPAEENPNVDSVPHYFFRQLAVNIVPAWGDFQTGYTQLNITVSLDLRKWCTYYLPPPAFQNKSIEEKTSEGVNTKITCAIRDMTKNLDVETRSNVELVEVADIDSRNFEQVSQWTGEIKQLKNKAEFFVSRFNVFKLPANLYDPNGINTKGEKGVWLNAYQFKMYYSDEVKIFRATGYQRDFLENFGSIPKSHFSLNRNADTGIPTFTPIGKIGLFPYEKPWTINYPEPYLIPKPPTQFNPNKIFDNNGADLQPTEPTYLDGDKAGFDNGKASDYSGYGLQNIGGIGNANQFAREVTQFSVFKYERDVSWHDQYSNGYQPAFPAAYSPYGTVSQVLNGERWQRLEAGYSYWLKPEGWPRISNNSWGDGLIASDYFENTSYGPFPPTKFSPPSFFNNIYKLRENILIRLDSGVGFTKNGSFDIYRITNPDKVFKPLPPPITKFVNLNFQTLVFSGKRKSQSVTDMSIGSANEDQYNKLQQGTVYITNNGTTKVNVTVGSVTKNIEPSIRESFDELSDQSIIKLPSNNMYDSESNSYTTAKYTILLQAVISDANNGGPYSVGTGEVCYGGEIKTFGNDYYNKEGLLADEDGLIPNYYLVQILPTEVYLFGNFGNFGVLLSGKLLPKRVAINGFAYEVWREGNSFPLASSDWVATYFPNGTGVYTRNPFANFYPNKLPEPYISGGNFPFGLV